MAEVYSFIVTDKENIDQIKKIDPIIFNKVEFINSKLNEINNLEIILLNNYEALAWSDICEDKSSETCEALISFFKGLNIENYSVNLNNQELSLIHI